MHKYLRAIGFSRYQNRIEVRTLLDRIQERYQSAMQTVSLNNGDTLWETRAELGLGMGVVMSGYMDEAGKAIRESYFPYFLSPHRSSDVYCSIQRHVEAESYSGLLDDVRVGISLIFRLINEGEYLRRKQKLRSTEVKEVHLTAFSVDGKILLPLHKDARQRAVAKVAEQRRGKLIEAARNGDEKAMESLTNKDMEMYTSLSRRMQKEDIYSIVDSSFMPEGIECNLYSVIGDIQEISLKRNLLTGEQVWDLLISANEIPLHVSINQLDLQGDPQIGRRFKGTIWLQGEAIWADQEEGEPQ